MILRALRALALLPVRLYQRFLSPLKPPTCRFEPSCSHYAVQAVERHGVLRGGLITSLRILRCNPFSEPGPDPVPAQWRRAVRLRARGDARAGADKGSSTSPAPSTSARSPNADSAEPAARAREANGLADGAKDSSGQRTQAPTSNLEAPAQEDPRS